jgi:hypothetical protein
MKRAHVLFALLVVLAVVGYGPVMTLVRQARYGRPDPGPATCDYAGRSYRLSEQRRADDGCNVCACGEEGWACTKIACVPGGPGVGTIAGALAYPSEVIPAQRICAVNLADDKEYCQQVTDGTPNFAVPAPAGEYWVYAALADDATGKRAYWSEFVRCGLKAECKDHTPVTVAVTKGEIVEAHPNDWYAPGQVDLINVSPSRFEYSTHNYYPNSVFLVKARGLVAVELEATPYPPEEGAAFSPIGSASMTSEERGIQTWSLKIPAGFQAMHVRAKGTSADGAYLLSRTVRLVRPIETASASSTIE